jgi:YfiH family protein
MREPADGPREAWRSLVTLVPQWQAPPGVKAFVTGRAGGVSTGPWGLDGDLPGGLNLGARCGDDPAHVSENRKRLAAVLPSSPHWLHQVHGLKVHRVAGTVSGTRRPGNVEFQAEPECGPAAEPEPVAEPVADAAVTDRPGEVLAVLTADCLPVFLADSAGRSVGIAHAGWRGMAAGVIENTVAALRAGLPAGAHLQAWLGPSIGPLAFEVGDEVRQAFLVEDDGAAPAFLRGRQTGKWFADLYFLARRRLHAAGVATIDGGGACTFSDAARFWSFRRCPQGGRMASVIWIER